MNKEFFHGMREQMNPSEGVVNELQTKIDNSSYSKKHIRIWKYATSIAACFVMAISVIALSNSLNKETPIIPDPGNAATIEETYVIPHWDDMTVSEKYGEITLNNVKYDPNRSEIDESAIDQLLGRAIAKGYDVYNNDKEYTINCDIYSLKAISTECAVAIKYEGYDGYYSFINSYYFPKNLGELINNLNLYDNLIFNKIYYSYWKNNEHVLMEYTLPDTSVIWNLLLSDISVENVSDEHYKADVMGISIDVNVIGHKNISLAVNEDGYLQTNILNTAKSFYIGKDKVQQFIDYVLENGTGTIFSPKTDGTNVLE